MERRVRDGRTEILCTDDLNEAPTAEWFVPPVGAGDEPVGGRGSAYFVKTPAGACVLRLYRRGGLAARISEQSYLYTGEEAVRSFAEFRLTSLLFREGFPVPRPIAAAYERRSQTYRAALITRRLKNTQTLAERLAADGSVDSDVWDSIGHVLGRLHARGVFHADLNAHNILIDDHEQVFIIDFDRGRLRSGTSWHQANIQRLERSLRKLNVFDSVQFARMEAAHQAT